MCLPGQASSKCPRATEALLSVARLCTYCRAILAHGRFSMLACRSPLSAAAWTCLRSKADLHHRLPLFPRWPSRALPVCGWHSRTFSKLLFRTKSRASDEGSVEAALALSTRSLSFSPIPLDSVGRTLKCCCKRHNGIRAHDVDVKCANEREGRTLTVAPLPRPLPRRPLQFLLRSWHR